MRYKNEYNRFLKDNTYPTSIKLNLVPYWLLAILRLALTLIPQIGYIHPDEYFQSIEVIAGEYFDIDVYKPWEYNATFPIRSILIPYLTIGIPYSVLNRISPYSYYVFGTTLKTPFSLVIFPRLLICALSFLSDYCLYKICYIYGQNYRTRLITFASSYVILIYATRTFSNTIELVLTSTLIYFVAKCMATSDEIVYEDDYLSEKYKRAGNVVDRVKYFKLRASLPSHSLNNCLILATITVVGIFNRPTFVAFAFAPIFFWLQRGLGSKNIGLGDFHIRIFTFVLCTVPTVILFILTDSFYFGYLTLSEIHNLQISMNNFVVTPLNFLKYNSVTKNLANHGLHPQFLHLLVNVPLLYNVLGFVGLFAFGNIIYRCLRGRWSELPRIQSIIGLMTASFILPILMLSVFPHQEPRFLIPVTLPLIFLHSQRIRHVSTVESVSSSNSDESKLAFRRNKNSTNKVLVVWYVVNIVLTFFYGFLHQGGVLPLVSHLAAELKAKPHATNVHLFTSHIYSIPTALLQLRNTRKTYVTREQRKYKLAKDFHLYEQGSENVEQIYQNIVDKIQECEKKLRTKKQPYRLYYALPATFLDEFTRFRLTNQPQVFLLKTVKTFRPHISIEKLPVLDFFYECNDMDDLEICTKKIVDNFLENFYKCFRQLGLVLLKIESSIPGDLIT
ncbi:GPI mannosyltransferase 4 [Neodiprion lecontei]|uniref:Mannosyltransferase n=1 Tax=Neodiprion lecontei TaxID=441921 RepID=A0A6J0CEF0_NEOLC|nr:GPI mannosyltransferase 4 [Neodiprion lecontei]